MRCQKKFFCIVLAVVLLLLPLNGMAIAASDDGSVGTADTKAADGLTADGVYRSVQKSYRQPAYKGQEIAVSAALAVTGDGGFTVQNGILGENGDAVCIPQSKSASFRVNLPQSARYTVKIKYCDLSDSTLPISCGVTVDGVYPFYEMRSQQFESDFYYADQKFAVDRYGNEIVPESVKKESWYEKYFCDASALTLEPFELELEAGEHTLTFHCIQGEIGIEKMVFGAMPEKEYCKTGNADGKEIRVIEGEAFAYKNSATVCPAGEFDTSVFPYSYSGLKLNMLSGSSFSDGGQSVTYCVSVKKSGYYNIGFRYRQSAKSDFPVFRTVLFDGKRIGKNSDNVAFDYSRSFENMKLETAIYIEAGREHTLTLSVSLQNVADSIGRVKALIGEINETSLQIMKITGNSISKYRDFDIAAYIPDIEPTLLRWADEIDGIYEDLHRLNPDVKTVGEFSTLKICVKQLKSLAEDTDDLPNRINELYQGDSSVNQYLAKTLESLYASPLAIDRVFIYQNGAKLPKEHGFFYKIAMGFCRFVYSFVDEYAETGDDEKEIEIWVNRSRLYIELMQKMADDGFYAKTGLTANFSIMPNEEKLVLASAAGNAPDIALGVTYTIPFELAIRGAIYDLSRFPDWAEVSSRFGQGLVNVGAVDGGYYLIPETSDFLVMFYRKDILDELNIPVPDTMEDVKSIIPVLKRYGMDFYSHIAGHSGTKTLSVLVPFLYQNNARVYGKTAKDLQMTSDAMVKAFEEMSDLFTIYDAPYEISNFYQHFRSGSIPIGISGFNTYMTLLNSAPEIESSWSVAPYPGYRDESGKVLRYIGGAQSTAVIFSDCKSTDNAWSFLKWWTDADTQSKFADTLQHTYGNEYMWNTANLEAFRRLPWNEEHKAAILEMMNWIVEVPRVPGNYMTQRSLSNALNNVILNGDNIRRELYEAQKDTDAEIDSKLTEFGYIRNGKKIRDFKIVG